MIYITSFNYGMYLTRFQNLVESFRKRKTDLVELLVYHECSNENVDPVKMKLSGIESRDIFLCRPELQDVISLPNFNEELLKTEKWSNFNYHAQFFARKVFSIYDAVLKNKNHEILCWIDCDSVVRNSNHHIIKEFGLKNDICYRDRTAKLMPSETGFIIFNLTNPLVMEFIKKWKDMYVSGDVFDLECWADHCVFDYVRTLFPSLNYSNLYDSNVDGIIRHCKGHKNQVVLREKSKDFFKTTESSMAKTECSLYKKLSVIREKRRRMIDSMSMLGQNKLNDKSVSIECKIGDMENIEDPKAIITDVLNKHIKMLNGEMVGIFLGSSAKDDDDDFWKAYNALAEEIDLFERLRNNLFVEKSNCR